MDLSVSTFYLPFDEIRGRTAALESAGIDMFHVDFMDGNFVQNLGMGIQDLDALRRCTKKVLDVHLMVREPGRYVQLMADHGADIVYIHPEACLQPASVLQHIRSAGMKSGIAVSPSVSIPTVEELLPLCDWVLVLGVNPGFANQPYLPHVEKKAVRLAQMSRQYGCRVIMDGAITLEIVERLTPQGILSYVLGNRVLLEHDPAEYAACVERVRRVEGGAAAP